MVKDPARLAKAAPVPGAVLYLDLSLVVLQWRVFFVEG